MAIKYDLLWKQYTGGGIFYPALPFSGGEIFFRKYLNPKKDIFFYDPKTYWKCKYFEGREGERRPCMVGRRPWLLVEFITSSICMSLTRAVGSKGGWEGGAERGGGVMGQTYPTTVQEYSQTVFINKLFFQIHLFLWRQLNIHSFKLLPIVFKI